MKLLIASDIHGSLFACNRLMEVFARENPDRLVLLGDLLYHGPRNPLPREYDPQGVAALLNRVKESLLCVRGNCEAEVDQMLLEFPVMADYAWIYDGSAAIFATHGHLYGEQAPPPFSRGSILLNGHTHVPAARREDGFLYLNCGSVALPKGGFPPSYMLYQDGNFTICDFEGNPLFACTSCGYGAQG